MDRLRSEVRAGFDIVFTIGTCSLFPCIAAPVPRARETGTPNAEINPDSTAVTRRVQIKMAETLDRFWQTFLDA